MRPWLVSLHRGAGLPGHALDVGEDILDGHHVGVLGLDVHQVCLVRFLCPVADALARDERRVAVLEEVYGGRPDAAARRRAAEDDGVHALRDQDRGEVRAEEGRGALLEDYGFFLSSLEAWVYLDPLTADDQLSEPGSLLEPEGAVLQVRLEAYGGEDDRDLPLAGDGEETTRLLDLLREVRAHRGL